MMETVQDFHVAVTRGDCEQVTRMLENGLVGIDQEYHFLTPLGTSVKWKQNSVARILLEGGCDVNRGDLHGKSPLYIASRMGNLDLVKLLLKYSPKLELQHVNGNTALHEAVVRGHTDITRELIHAGCNVNAFNNGKESPLHMACLIGFQTIAQMLIKAGADVRARKGKLGVEPIHLTAYGGHIEIMKLLLLVGVDINTAKGDNGRTPLHIAAIHNCVEFVKALIKHGCLLDPISSENEEAKTPLLKAVELGHVELAQILVDAGADTDRADRWGVTPLLTVMLKGKTTLAKMLIQGGCSVNNASQNGVTPFSASLRNAVELTILLVMADCQLTATDKEHLGQAIDLADNSERKFLLEEICRVMSHPRTLQHLCRTLIRHVIGQNCQSKLYSLTLPSKLIEYLRFNDQ